MHRRAFVQFAAGLIPTAAAQCEPFIPIVDAHIHLFDPTRRQGVPWPPKEDAVLYKPALPARYRKVAEPFGVVGAIEIEASPWVEDNQWVLDIAAVDRIVVGTVGNLEPGQVAFPKQLERFHKNPLFLGIRYGNLWGRDLGARLAEPAFVDHLRMLAGAGLELDTANPDAALVRDVVRLTDKVPDLRVVIDHLPHLRQPADPLAGRRYAADLRELGKRPQVYVKISEVLQRVNGRVSHDLSFYRSMLDHLWEIFGEDRLIYGSDWPNSDPWGSYSEVVGLVRSYFAGKGRRALEKYFWRNSAAAYRWKPRDAKQPQL